MLDFVENRDQCSKMGLKGREHIEMNFDNSKLNDKLVNIYEKIGFSGLKKYWKILDKP